MNFLSKNIMLLIVLIFQINTASAIPFGGIEFPDGATSFADAVVSSSLGSDAGSTPALGTFDDPSQILGVPNRVIGPPSTGVVALGDGGEIIVRFIDNSLTTSGDNTQDLWIFEVGDVETFNVAISINGINWIDLGNVSGQPTGIDIDSIAGVISGERYSFVRVRDVDPPDQTVFPFGEADIDAIGAISSTTPNEAPSAVNDTIITAFNTATAAINVLTNDTDPENDSLSVTSNSNPTNGSITQTGNTFIYTPNSGFSGSDNFSYTISDGHGNNSTANVNITVNITVNSSIPTLSLQGILITILGLLLFGHRSKFKSRDKHRP